MEKWVQENLSKLLDFQVPDDLVQYIVQMQDERDLQTYLVSLLGNGNSKHKQFIIDLKKQRASYNNQTGYKKTNDNDNISNKQNDKKKGKVKGKETVQDNAKPGKSEKKKIKYVNLYSQEEGILLKGRHKCDCEARKHTLINNCFNCGRIVCKQEGSGPCFFCGELVCSPEEQIILQSNTKKADSLYNRLKEQKPSKGFEESLKQRDKLLEYDRNSTRRTKVIDDESDYYQSNSIWLSATEREKLQKQEAETTARKHASRLDKKMTLDFMGRTVTDEYESDEQYNDAHEEFSETMLSEEFQNLNVCPTIEFNRPTFIETESSKAHTRVENRVWNTESRIQDKEYLEMSDQGLCLSIQQPFASLLVAGIKTHEGRTWYSPHRGRLWIASAAKVPSTEEISNIEHCYHVLKNEELIFPDTYPTACLLGCVTITDVLSQEEYKKSYPEGECDSPYVFICENHYILPIHIPIRGKNKIYKLEKKIHQAATKCLERVMKTSSH